MKCFAFLDTNIFLHYVDIDQIDWLKHLGVGEAVLVVAPIVIRELNRHKDSPSSPKTRDRAAKSLKKLHAWSEQMPPIVVRNRVELQFRISDPQIDFSSQRLSHSVPDDYLLATVIEFRNEFSDDLEVVLVTDDLGLKLKSKAHAIRTLHLPPASRLPEELSASDKHIRQLETEVRRLQQRLPAPTIAFPSGEDRVLFTLKAPEPLSPDNVRISIEEIRNEYPKQNANLHDTNSFPRIADLLPHGWRVNVEDIEHYNHGLDKFYLDYEKYLYDTQQFREAQSRTARLDLVVINTGTAPAEGLDVGLHFPDGFELLLESDQLPAEPKLPNRPRQPMALLDQMYSMGLSRSMLRLPDSMLGAAYTPTLPKIRNVGRPSIRRSKSYTVELSVRKVKHGFAEPIDPLYIVFSSIPTAFSFEIDYWLHADNLPDRVEGKLHVIVEAPVTG